MFPIAPLPQRNTMRIPAGALHPGAFDDEDEEWSTAAASPGASACQRDGRRLVSALRAPSSGRRRRRKRVRFGAKEVLEIERADDVFYEGEEGEEEEELYDEEFEESSESEDRGKEEYPAEIILDDEDEQQLQDGPFEESRPYYEAKQQQQQQQRGSPRTEDGKALVADSDLSELVGKEGLEREETEEER
mgnify:CR=1 FL=1